MKAPLRWKKLCTIWLGMYPVNIASSLLITILPWWGDVSLPVRSIILVSFVAPIMTFIMMPTVTRLLNPWLNRRRDHLTCERTLVAALDQLPPSLPDMAAQQTALARDFDAVPDH